MLLNDKMEWYQRFYPKYWDSCCQALTNNVDSDQTPQKGSTLFVAHPEVLDMIISSKLDLYNF